jgi:hypothetical protein
MEASIPIGINAGKVVLCSIQNFSRGVKIIFYGLEPE